MAGSREINGVFSKIKEKEKKKVLAAFINHRSVCTKMLLEATMSMWPLNDHVNYI
jgi:hypothetical protein